MAYSDPNIHTVDIVEQDPITGLISEANCKGVPPVVAGKFALECQITDLDGTGIYINTGTVASPVWTLQGANIEDDAVTEDKIADDAVTSDKIDDGTIVEEDIADDAVTADKLADNAVVTANIVAKNVTGDKIADKAVDTAQIADGAIEALQISANAVETEKIKDANVTGEKIANKAVDTAQIADSAIEALQINTGAVETDKILDANVTLGKLAAGITPGYIVKFFVLGSNITGTALEGLAVDDLIVTIPTSGSVSVAVCTVGDTLPADPAGDSFLIVFRAAA